MTELAYIDRTINWTTTNTSMFDTGSAAKIDNNFYVTVVGTGAAVEVEFYAPAVGNGSGLVMTSWFVITTTDKAAVQYRRWVASSGGVGGSMKARLVLPNSVSHKIEVGFSATGASTTTVYGAQTAIGAMFLRITG